LQTAIAGLLVCNEQFTEWRFVLGQPRRYGYPPDKQEKATETVLEQAALLSADWAA
jgi:Domain of unknown function (DUF3387)